MVLPKLVGKQLESQGGVQWSTSEVKTELVCPMTGKPIYRKYIDLGLLPNSTTGTVAHGIATLNVAEGAHLLMNGVVSDGTTVDPLFMTPNLTVVSVDATNVNLLTTADLSSYRALMFLEYTKT